MVKKIAILTSGGDCAGLNAVIRAATIRAVNKYKWQIFGIKDGTLGLMTDPLNVVELKPSNFDGNLMRMGGTFLGTNSKGYPSHEEVIKGFKKLELDALIGIGGDGSMKILKNLTKKGKINFVGIPKTIDNDVMDNELSIGYDTAVDVATNALDMLQPTAASHRRAMILEVMGRDAGHIALNSGIAIGAQEILIPEESNGIEELILSLKKSKKAGKTSSIVVVAEGDKTGSNVFELAKNVEKKFPDYEIKVSVLGHMQRGGSPSCFDRVLATRMGVKAVESLIEGYCCVMVGVDEGKLTLTPLKSAIKGTSKINSELLRVSEIMNT
jgi:6-phosphofructokinase 1